MPGRRDMTGVGERCGHSSTPYFPYMLAHGGALVAGYGSAINVKARSLPAPGRRYSYAIAWTSWKTCILPHSSLF